MTALLVGRPRTRHEIHRSLVAYGIFGCAGMVLRGKDHRAVARMTSISERIGKNDPRRRVLRRAIDSLLDLNGGTP